MADYISALNGEQMDSALMDVALRNSEAWAVGQRNGVPVTSADETYHNNAKYYAQVAQSAIPGTYTAAVRWDIAQGLAGEAQEQARANISAGASNRNLLDNPFFTVNQRDFTSVTATNGVYAVDRWKINNGGGTGSTISVTSQGYIQLTTGSTYISFQQMFGANELEGKTVTMSVNDNGTIYSYSFTVPTRGSADVTAGTFVFKTGCSCNFFVMNTSSAYGYNIQLSIGTGYSATIRAVKLELGSYSTLANDVPPDYVKELEKCKYYFERIQARNVVTSIGAGYNDGYNTMYGVLKIAPKRQTPSVSGSSLIVGTTSLNVTSSSKGMYAFASDGSVVLQIIANNTFTTNAMYRFGLPANGYLDFSADF